MRRSLGLKLAVAVGSVVLALGLLEAGFRLAVAREVVPDTKAGFAVPDPDLIWRLAPVESGKYATNQLGLRDTYYNANEIGRAHV